MIKFDYVIKGKEDAPWPNVLNKIILNTKGKRMNAKLYVPPDHVHSPYYR